MAAIPLIAAAASFFGGKMANQRRSRDSRQQREWQESMWNKQNAYNTPQQQMARLRKAGLNPALMYGQGNVGNADKVGNYQTPQIENVGAAAAQGAAAGVPVSLVPEQKQVLRADSIQKLANADNLKSTSNRTNQLIQAELNNINAGTKKITSEVDLLEQTIQHQKDTGMLKGDILGNLAKALGININTPEGRATVKKKIDNIILLKGIQTIAPSLLNNLFSLLPNGRTIVKNWDKLSDAQKTKELEKVLNRKSKLD